MKSIMQDIERERRCYLCGRNGNGDPLELHHVFFGTANRRLSDEDGLTVLLCGCRCHRLGPQAVHKCKKTDDFLKAKAQEAWESRYGSRDDFMARYGKSYL